MKLKDKKYLCTKDSTSHTFILGNIGDIEFWRECGRTWTKNLPNQSMYYCFKYVGKTRVIETIEEYFKVELNEVSQEFYNIYTEIRLLMCNKKILNAQFKDKDYNKEQKYYFQEGYYSAIRVIINVLLKMVAEKKK